MTSSRHEVRTTPSIVVQLEPDTLEINGKYLGYTLTIGYRTYMYPTT